MVKLENNIPRTADWDPITPLDCSISPPLSSWLNNHINFSSPLDQSIHQLTNQSVNQSSNLWSNCSSTARSFVSDPYESRIRNVNRCLLFSDRFLNSRPNLRDDIYRRGRKNSVFNRRHWLKREKGKENGYARSVLDLVSFFRPQLLSLTNDTAYMAAPPECFCAEAVTPSMPLALNNFSC